MIELALAVAFVVALGAASIRAGKRFRDTARLPMQWTLTGKVNWTAPRRVALAFTPVIAAIVLGAISVAVALSGEARDGQEGMGPLVVLVVGTMFLAVHAFHLRLIERSVRT